MIQINDLTFGYNKKSLLFKNLDLKLEAGHIYGLLGKNGAGKSTLLKNLAGLVYPLAGECKVNGYKAADRLPAFLQELFFIPEEIYLPNVPISQFIKNTAHFYPKFKEELFYKILKEFEVLAGQKAKDLSFGQQKKVMIAFGLATDTNLLIMDEPTNGLDIPSKIQFRKIIASALTEDRCILISTHQVRDLDNLIDTLLVLSDRQVVLNSSLDRVGERLRFIPASSIRDEEVLYTAEHTLGINTIAVNHNQDAGKVDLELLFNAITSGHQSIIDVLK